MEDLVARIYAKTFKKPAYYYQKQKGGSMKTVKRLVPDSTIY